VEAVEVEVPTGLRRADGVQRRMWLRPWSGEDVAALGEGPGAGAQLAERTSELLGRCLSLDAGGTAAGAAVARRLTVGDREALLLHLYRLTHGDRLDLVASCPRCGERLELELRAADLLLPTEAACEAEQWTDLAGPAGAVPVRVRLPTGEDQERAARRSADEAAAARELLRACLLEVGATDAVGAAPSAGSGLPAELEAMLAEKLGELDPQAEIRLAAICPHCRSAIELGFDAGELVHAEIDGARDRLFREVHLLALYYHWSEAEILAMSSRRRRRYLELLAAAGEDA
jgi:hypothetical protein